MTVPAEMSWGFEVAVASCPVGAQNTEECWKETSQAGGRPLKEPGRAEKGSYSSVCSNISTPGLRHLCLSSLLHQCPGSLTWLHFLGELGCTLGMQNRGGGVGGQGGSKLPIRMHLASDPSEAGQVARGLTRRPRACLSTCSDHAPRARRPVRSGSDRRVS